MFWEELNDARRVEIEPRASEVEVEEFHASGICGKIFDGKCFLAGEMYACGVAWQEDGGEEIGGGKQSTMQL